MRSILSLLTLILIGCANEIEKIETENNEALKKPPFSINNCRWKNEKQNCNFLDDIPDDIFGKY